MVKGDDDFVFSNSSVQGKTTEELWSLLFRSSRSPHAYQSSARSEPITAKTDHSELSCSSTAAIGAFMWLCLAAPPADSEQLSAREALDQDIRAELRPHTELHPEVRAYVAARLWRRDFCQSSSQTGLCLSLEEGYITGSAEQFIQMIGKPLIFKKWRQVSMKLRKTRAGWGMVVIASPIGASVMCIVCCWDRRWSETPSLVTSKSAQLFRR